MALLMKYSAPNHDLPPLAPPPYPNVFVDEPAIDHRILIWIAWKYGVDGVFTPGANGWGEENKNWPDKPWVFSDKNHPGAALWVYPHRNGTPLSSIRLEVLRDGIEDYEYLYLLKEKINELEASGKRCEELVEEAKRLLVIDDSIIESPTSYTKDAERIYTRRERIAQQIEKISKALSK